MSLLAHHLQEFFITAVVWLMNDDSYEWNFYFYHLSWLELMCFFCHTLCNCWKFFSFAFMWALFIDWIDYWVLLLLLLVFHWFPPDRKHTVFSFWPYQGSFTTDLTVCCESYLFATTLTHFYDIFALTFLHHYHWSCCPTFVLWVLQLLPVETLKAIHCIQPLCALWITWLSNLIN